MTNRSATAASPKSLPQGPAQHNGAPITLLWEADLENLLRCGIPQAATHLLCDLRAWNKLSPMAPQDQKLPNSDESYQNRQASSSITALQKRFPEKATVAVLCHAEWLQEEGFQMADAYYIPGPHCRQADLLTAAAKTAKPLFVERGSFLAPIDFQNVIERVAEHRHLTLVDAGSHFGYGDRVLDPRSLVLCQNWQKRFGTSFALSFTDLTAADESASEYRPRWLSENTFSDFVFKMSALWNCGMVFKKHPLSGFEFLDTLLPFIDFALGSTASLRQLGSQLTTLNIPSSSKQKIGETNDPT